MLKHAKSLEEELEQLRSKFELETLRALAEETSKWEAREDRLTRRLDELQELRNRENGIRAAREKTESMVASVKAAPTVERYAIQ